MPCTLGLQRSLWQDVNSAPNLLQERVTQDLLDPWSRAWSTGQSGRLRVSRAGLELKHLQELKRGVLNTEDSPHPWVVGGGDGAGRAGTICCVAISPDSSVVTLGGGSERVLWFFLSS